MADGRLADDSNVDLAGAVDFRFRIEGHQIRQRFLVVEADNTSILGMDFFREHYCILDFSGMKLITNDEELVAVSKAAQGANI